MVLVAEVSTGAWAYHNKEKLDAMIRATVKNTIQNEYSVIEGKTAAFDTFQSHVSNRYKRPLFLRPPTNSKGEPEIIKRSPVIPKNVT